MLGLGVLVILGLVGYVMRELRFDRALVVLGMVLGSLTEASLRDSPNIGHGDVMIFFQRPLSAMVLLLLALILVGVPLTRSMRREPAVVSGQSRQVAE